jgi:hypothetical protein
MTNCKKKKKKPLKNINQHLINMDLQEGMVVKGI